MRKVLCSTLVGAAVLGAAVCMAWLALWWGDRRGAVPAGYPAGLQPTMLADPGCSPCAFKGAGGRLGRWLAGQCAGNRAVLVLPSAAGPASLTAASAREGLEAGLDGAVEVTATVSLPPGPVRVVPQPVTPVFPPAGSSPAAALAELSASGVRVEDFDRALAGIEEPYELIISLAGLPADWPRLAALQHDPVPRLAVVYAVSEAVPMLAEGVREGRVLAVVAPRLVRLPPTPSGDGSPDAAFDRQFVLVTLENLEAAIEANPWLFSSATVPWATPEPPAE